MVDLYLIQQWHVLRLCFVSVREKRVRSVRQQCSKLHRVYIQEERINYKHPSPRSPAFAARSARAVKAIFKQADRRYYWGEVIGVCSLWTELRSQSPLAALRRR